MDIQKEIQGLFNAFKDQHINPMKSDMLSLLENQKANQEIIDSLSTSERKTNNKQGSFQHEWNQKINEVWNSKQAEIKDFQTDKNAKLTFQLKVANMTSDVSITGDGVASYGQRQGLVPTQSVNFRDLIPSVKSPSGIYVTFTEGVSSGSFSVQTEGQSKTQIDYKFTEVKTVSDYIAAFAVCSKQLMFNLPFLTTTLPRMLLRDFYKKENAQHYGQAYLAATGDSSTPAVGSGGPVNDAEELLYWINNSRSDDFNPSFALVNWSDATHLLKTGRNSNSGYGVPGGFIFDNNGNMMIAGVPVIAASWITAGNPLIIDRDYIERVETESLRVEFSYEDNDNFRKNLVTIRCECFEDLNLLRTDAHVAAEFGGS